MYEEAEDVRYSSSVQLLSGAYAYDRLDLRTYCCSLFEKFIPWIALILLAFIGGKMLVEGIKNKDCTCEEKPAVGIGMLIMQGVATSIDALSVGFTISDYNLTQAIVCALLIAFVTFFICLGGIIIGRKFGTKLSGKASIFGGVILIAIGIEIFITGVII